MKKIRIILAALSSLTIAATNVTATPILLEDMGIQKQWTDTEAARDEMPGFVWGDTDTALADRIGLHFLHNTPMQGRLPIAWIRNPGTPFGNNVELDDHDSSVISEFRVTTKAWGSALSTTYSSSAPTEVPYPGPLALLGLGLAGMGFDGRKGA